MLRDLRRADGPEFLALMERGFPEESALLGGRPEEFEKMFRRVFRWDARFLLALLKLLGRPIVRMLVVEQDRRLVAESLVTFPAGAAYVSTVVVDERYRRRGYARQMLEEARNTARRAKREFLVLDVLESNTGARALYDSLGYRPLEQRFHLVQDTMDRFGSPPPANPNIRALRRSDVPGLVEVLKRQTPPEVEKVLPTRKDRFVGSGVANRMMATEEASWVIDRGHGPEGHVAAAVSQAMQAAHFASPTLAESVDDRLALDLVTTAATWCASRRVPRIISMVSGRNARGRAALEAIGFRHALPLWTLYRTVD
jgi:ribosomal protein S18 acetylase RimI-like enzyme